MAALLRDVYCPACGGHHTLCDPDEDTVYSNREYEYDCPSNKRTVRVPKDEWSEPIPDCPDGAVMIREVKS